MYSRVLILFFLTLAFFTAKSQNWVIYNTVNSGLPANEVLCVAQDNDNNKWIGTYWGGVAKFDNHHWKVYTDTNSGMPHYTIRAIAIDLNNDKWFGTPSGVAHLSGTTFTVYDTSNSILPSNFINLIRIDSDGNKWIGTNKGLVKFDGQNWQLFTTANSNIPSNYIQSLEIDDNDDLWVGTYGGLAYYQASLDEWTVLNTTNSPLQDNTIYSIGITKNNRVWVRTFDEVLSYDGTNWGVYDEYSLGQPNSFCRTIPATDSTSLWIGGDEGLVHLYVHSGVVDSAGYFNSFNSGLPNNGVITLFSDRMQNLWAGVSLGNLVVYNPEGVDLVSIAEKALASNLSAYPVPASDNVTVRFYLASNEDVLLEALDLSGRKVMPDVLKRCYTGSNQFTIQTHAFKHGFYFIRLSSGSHSSVLKIVAGQ